GSVVDSGSDPHDGGGAGDEEEPDGAIGSGGSGGSHGSGGSGSGGVSASGGAVASGGATACECAAGDGPCCDGCHFKPQSIQCFVVKVNDKSTWIPYETKCAVIHPSEQGCGSGASGVDTYYRDHWCSGTSSACDGRWTPVFSTFPICEMGSECRSDGSGLTAAKCVPCP